MIPKKDITRMKFLAGIITEEIDELFSEENLIDSASSIKGERIIATLDDFGNDESLPPKSLIHNVAVKYGVGYAIEKYPEGKAIIFFNKLNSNSQIALKLYNKYMNDYSSLSKKEHEKLGGFFGYGDGEILDFVSNLDNEFSYNKETLQPQTIFQNIGDIYMLTQDIPPDIKYNPKLAPVIKKGDRFKIREIEINPINTFWMVYVDSIDYPEKLYSDFRIIPPNKPADRYADFVYKHMKKIK